MGHQIIKQPDGLFAVFSTYSDSWIVWDASPEELSDYYAERAEADARENTARLLALIEENPRLAYYQFTMTFAAANESSVAHDGPDLSEKLDNAADG